MARAGSCLAVGEPQVFLPGGCSCTRSCSRRSRQRSTMAASTSSAAPGSRTTATCRRARLSSANSSTVSDISRAGTSLLSYNFVNLTSVVRFGKRCETGWLPDSFGLTGAYPQIMRLSGMKYFFTQKLSWNNMSAFSAFHFRSICS
jgi:hypothetical protein